MSILYALISKRTKEENQYKEKILCDQIFSSSSSKKEKNSYSNFPHITLKVLRKIKLTNKPSILKFDDFKFFYINNENIIFLCMCNIDYDNNRGVRFLNKILLKFYSTFKEEEINNSIQYSLNSFNKDIKEIGDQYNNNEIDSDEENMNIDKLKKNLIETKDILINSNEMLDLRGENMKVMLKKAGSLKDDSSIYSYGANKMKNRFKRKNYIYIIIFFTIFGGFLFYYFNGNNKKEYKSPSLTADAIVLRKHKNDDKHDILLDTRGNDHLAFLGGFVEYNEDPMKGCLRELKEETNLDGFDIELLTVRGNPKRDPRKHVVTIAYTVIVNENAEPIGADDAKDAKFYNLEDIYKNYKNKMSFDHYEIIEELIQKKFKNLYNY